MKIAIFENEYKSVKLAFEACNSIFFQDKLEFKNFPRSQDFNFDDLNNYMVFFVDIDLSSRSEFDGYTLIKKMLELDANIGDRIVVLTGNNKINEGLKDNNVDAKLIKNILIKPTNFKEIAEKIKVIQRGPDNK